MKSLEDIFQLYNEVTVPCIGFGTWQIPDGSDGSDAVSDVRESLSAGYRHIGAAA